MLLLQRSKSCRMAASSGFPSKMIRRKASRCHSGRLAIADQARMVSSTDLGGVLLFIGLQTDLLKWRLK